MDVKYLILQEYQIEVFKYYMNISEYDIKYCLISKSNKVRNPLRYDKHPSLGFIQYRNKEDFIILYVKDFADDNFTGDCFTIAGKVLKLNHRNPAHFVKILQDIILNVILKNKIAIPMLSKSVSRIKRQKDYQVSSHLFFSYLVPTRLFTQYWTKLLYGDSAKILAENYVYQPANVFVEDTLVHIHSEVRENLAIMYYLGHYNEDNIYKLYKPFTRNKLEKFRTNNKFLIEAMHELKKNDNLILTKSRKDCIVLRSILKLLDISTIDVISVTSESIKLESDFSLDFILNRYDNIYSIFDYDDVGFPYMFYNYILNDIEPIVLKSEKSISSERCGFILETVYYNSGIQYELEELFSIMDNYTYSIELPNYYGKDISDLVLINKQYALNFITNILKNIYEKSSDES